MLQINASREQHFINERGEEIYPPYLKNSNAGMVKQESDITRRTKMPPKSEAETKMEIMNNLDKETINAIEVLKSKGLL